jgi:hypothetical protein
MDPGKHAPGNQPPDLGDRSAEDLGCLVQCDRAGQVLRVLEPVPPFAMARGGQAGSLA